VVTLSGSRAYRKHCPSVGARAAAEPWLPDFGVSRSTIQFWRNGKMRFGPDHPALVRLLDLADRRAEEITKARDELRDWLASQPPEDQA
jgi:hypothetical protein